MLLHSASQLLTLSGGPQRGNDLGRLEIITDGAVLIEDEQISAVGTSRELRGRYPHEPTLDVDGSVVMPGFVDPHTHAVWAGDRAAEFEMRVSGKTYLEILAEGGGILSTVRATRAAGLDQLIQETRPRLERMFAHGTTTTEVKTGYGLDLETEFRMLEACLVLDKEGPIEIVPTYLGAHAVPPEYAQDADGYSRKLCDQYLPDLKEWWLAHADGYDLPFVDVFCETGAFNLEQSRAVLTGAVELGFPLKIHADEFDNLGGTALAVELGAVSADHLTATTPEEISALGKSSTVAVLLPNTPFGLAENQYPDANAMHEAGCTIAIATDLNPGTAWCESIQFAIALACRYLRLTPAQAIAAATINAAEALRRADRIGSIEPGKQADILILAVDDYRHLGYRFGTNLVKTAIKKGRVYPV